MTTAAVEEQPETTTEQPVHLARCRECSVKVWYRSTSSGGGFMIVDHNHSDPSPTFGSSAANLPMCPDGHGEMELCDEQAVPVAEAFQQVADKLAEPVQTSLPGIVPDFNYAGAYLDLEATAVEVAALHKQAKDDAETAKESKKAWEKAAERYQRMAIVYRDRRREKVAQGEAVLDTAADLCRFEQLSPGVPCPLCADPARLEQSGVARDSEQHGVIARDLQLATEREAVSGTLAAVGFVLTAEDLSTLPPEQYAKVIASYNDASTPAAERVAAIEAVIAPHIASEQPAAAGEVQTCTKCGTAIAIESDFYVTGARVGFGCEGKAKLEGNRYPERKKRAQKKRQPSPAADVPEGEDNVGNQA